MEEFPLRVNGAHSCLQSVTEHDEGIVIEQLWNGVEIVAIVFVESVHYLHIVVLQFHKQQGDTIHEAHDVCSATIQGTMHLQLSHAKKLVLIWRSEVYHLGAYLFRFAIRLNTNHRYTITNQLILLFIDLHQRLRAHVLRHTLHALLQLLICQPGIQSLQGLTQMACQQHFVVIRAT